MQKMRHCEIHTDISLILKEDSKRCTTAVLQFVSHCSYLNRLQLPSAVCARLLLGSTKDRYLCLTLAILYQLQGNTPRTIYCDVYWISQPKNRRTVLRHTGIRHKFNLLHEITFDFPWSLRMTQCISTQLQNGGTADLLVSAKVFSSFRFKERRKHIS
jgi:hypothetical protein